jgi:hypothetical protein
VRRQQEVELVSHPYHNTVTIQPHEAAETDCVTAILSVAYGIDRGTLRCVREVGNGSTCTAIHKGHSILAVMPRRAVVVSIAAGS